MKSERNLQKWKDDTDLIKIKHYTNTYNKGINQKNCNTIVDIQEKGEKLLEAPANERYKLFNTFLKDFQNINIETLNQYYHSEQFNVVFNFITSELINSESFACGANFIRTFNPCQDYKLLIENIKDDIEDFIFGNDSKEAYDFYTMELCATSNMPSINFFDKTTALHDVGSFAHATFVYFLYKNRYKITKEALYQVINSSQGCEILIYELVYEATEENYIDIERVNIKVFIKAFYQFWRNSGIELHMCTWIAYCKKVNLSKRSVECIRKLVNDILNGTICEFNAKQKKFIIKFFQGVSYVDKGLFVSQKDIDRIIRTYRCDPTRRLIYIITALRSKTDNYDELNEETQKFVADVYESYDQSEYSEYDNGNESGAFDSEEESDGD